MQEPAEVPVAKHSRSPLPCGAQCTTVATQVAQQLPTCVVGYLSVPLHTDTLSIAFVAHFSRQRWGRTPVVE